MEILQYSFVQKAIIGAFLISLLVSLVGIYVVLKRIVFIVGGISHYAFGGVGIGFLLGINPIYVALPFGVLGSIIIGIISKRAKVSEDASIGILWAFGMAIGIIAIALTDKYTPDLMAYLFGSLLAISNVDLILMMIATVISLIIIVLFHREFVYISFDEDFAYTIGVNTTLFYFLLLSLIAFDIIVMIRAIGIILVIALISAPVVIARDFAKSIFGIRNLTFAISFGSSLLGLYLSYVFDVSASAIIVVLLFVLIIISKLIRRRG